MRTALNFLPQKLYVYIFVTKMAYSLSLISNYMDNSFLLRSRSNFFVFSSTRSSILFHTSNIWKISVGKHYNYYELYPARIGVVTGQPYWGFTGLTTGLMLYCLWFSETIVLSSTWSNREPRFEIMLRGISNITHWKSSGGDSPVEAEPEILYENESKSWEPRILVCCQPRVQETV